MDDIRYWNIYVDAFPEDERRSYEEHISLLNNENYNIKLINEDSEVIGFIAFWDFDEFIFIEHFAIDTLHRGKGFGGKELINFVRTQTKDIILEVEPEGNDICNRRISFYERAGFYLNHYDYIQPALEEGKNPIRLKVMSFNRVLDHEVFNNYKDMLYKRVYDV